MYELTYTAQIPVCRIVFANLQTGTYASWDLQILVCLCTLVHIYMRMYVMCDHECMHACLFASLLACFLLACLFVYWCVLYVFVFVC